MDLFATFAHVRPSILTHAHSDRRHAAREGLDAFLAQSLLSGRFVGVLRPERDWLSAAETQRTHRLVPLHVVREVPRDDNWAQVPGLAC